AVARPAENDHVAALRQSRQDVRRIRQHNKCRQRRRAITVRVFHRQQFIADEKRRLHRAGRNVEWLGDGGFRHEHREHDADDLERRSQIAFVDGLLCHDDRYAVPPTVILSMRNVGWPTPTGTPWPFLPQVPMPGSSAKSLPIIEMRWRSVGPLPISMAPLTGAPIFPFSIL